MELEIFKTLYDYDNFRIIDGKPSKEMVDYLKENGYRWSKKNNCWYPSTEDAKKANLYENFGVEFQKKFFTQKLTGQEETRPQSMIEKLIDNATNYKLDKESLINFTNYIEKNITKEQTAKLEKSIDNLKTQVQLRDEKIAQLERSLKITNEQNDDYIHSEEFISKFGDWEKANRIEKLKQADSIVGNSKIIVSSSDITDLVERLRTEYSVSNLKQLQNIAKDIGKEVISDYREKQKLGEYSNPEFKNIDIGENYKLQWTGIKEIKGHNIFQKGHIEAIRAIPEIIENGIYIGKEPNEDGRNPNLKEFYYFASGLKIDSDDYTVKSVFVKNDKGQIFYDQSLSSIEKGKFVDIIQQKNKPETVNLVNTKDSFELSENKSPSTYYDKRLINICQVPQMPYLEMVNGKWQPKQEAIQAVKDGKLFIEKTGQDYTMHDENQKHIKDNKTMENENTVESISSLQSALKNALKEVAIPLEKIEFTRDNYNKLFPEGYITTPIESVKMGKHQFEKLEVNQREFILQATHDTLSNPDLIINEQKENVFGEQEDSHLYAKSFLIDDKVHGVQSVVVSIDGENVSISTHERDINNFVNKIKKPDQLLYAAAKVRLLVERATGKQLVTVNPTREFEYVKSLDSNLQQNSESVKQKENLVIEPKPELKTYHKLKKEEIDGLKEITQEEFNSIIDALYQQPNPDYKEIPPVIKLPQINEEIAQKLGVENANFFMRSEIAHVRPQRKGSYGQALRIEEMKGMLDFIKTCKTAYIDNDEKHQNFMLAGLDEQDDKKSNKIVFNKDEYGNYIVTVGKVDTTKLGEKQYSKVAVGVEPTIWREIKSPSIATMLRSSTTSLNENIQRNSESVKQELKENKIMENGLSKSSEQIATELVLEKLKNANINVITDESEMQSILDAGIEVQKMAAHYGTNQNIENYDSFNGYGAYVLSINKENAKNLGLKIAAKKYGDSFYINEQPLQEFLQERKFSPYWQSVVNQISNPSQEELLYQIVNSNVKENSTLVKEQNQLITLCNLNLINYKREQTYLYSVEIPDNDGTNYLFYDKTVGLESANKINDELKKIGSDWKVSRNDTGKNIYFNMLSNKVFNSQKQASEFLRKIGYVGMEMDNSNYIIFDDREMNINNRVQYMMTENGEVYGFAYNGQIYADKNLMNSNVLAHEYTHLWDNYTKNVNPNLWEQGKNIFKQTNLWNEVVNDPSYQNIKNNEDEILSECHARICGKFAQQVLERIAKDNGENAKNSVIDWDNEVNEFVAKEFGFSPELGSENYISESIKAESMKKFLATPMKDLMNEFKLNEQLHIQQKENKIPLQEALKDALLQVAVPLEKVEFTRDNYNKLFPEGYITTPIESVKMGANQFEKLEEKERQNLLLAVHDTLKNPDLIINEHKENVFGENEDNHIYAKSFLIDDKVHGVQSVVVSIDGENVSISTHERSINNIVNKIKKPDQLLYAAAKVRLLVEQHTKEELPQLMVNPIRDNEYVVSPQPNIQQNSETVKQQQEIIDENGTQEQIDYIRKQQNAHKQNQSNEINQEKLQNISNLPKVSVKSYVSNEKFTGQNPSRVQKLRRELVETGTIKLEDDVFLVSELQIKSAGCNVKQGTTSVMILCPPDKKNPGFHEETYFHISAVDDIKRLEKFYNKNQSNENESLLIEDNKIIYGKTKIPPFTILINGKFQNIDNAIVLGYDKKSQNYLIQNGAEKINLKNETMQSILKNELNQNIQDNNQSEIKNVQGRAIVFEDKERNIHGTIIPEFSMITSHGFEDFKNCVITNHNENDDSYTLSNGDKSIVVTKETLKELTTQERFEKKYDENSKIYDKMLQSQYNDYFKIRNNTSYNFIHNFSVYCRKGANSPCNALELAKDIIDKMPAAEKLKTKKVLASLCKKGETINEVLVNAYHDAIKDFPLNEEYIKKYHPETKIARPFYDTVFENGEYIDNNVALKKGGKNLNLKIGDTVSNLNISVDKIFGYGKEKIHFDQLKIISSSKENDSITLMDKNKSFIELPRTKILTVYAQRQEKLNKQEQKKQKRDAIEISR